MALTKLTTSRHNIKRAEALASYGINTLDLPHAKPGFEGYGAGTCALCGKQNLKWLFQIHFDEPQGLIALAKIECEIDREGAITINPIGSSCINDWIDALPETREKLELLKRWDVEMRKCKEAMKAKVVEDLCLSAGFESPEAAVESYRSFLPRLYDRIAYRHASRVLNRYELRALDRNAYKVQTRRLGRKACQDWLKLLAKLVALGPYIAPASLAPAPAAPAAPVGAAPATPATSAASGTSGTDPNVKALLDKGAAAFALNAAKLKPYYERTYRDIHAKVTAAGKFVSPRQQKFYEDIVKMMN